MPLLSFSALFSPLKWGLGFRVYGLGKSDDWNFPKLESRSAPGAMFDHLAMLVLGVIPQKCCDHGLGLRISLDLVYRGFGLRVQSLGFRIAQEACLSPPE